MDEDIQKELFEIGGKKHMGKKMTEQTYKAIKLMLKGGATHEEIAEFYPVSKETLRRCRRTESIEEYHELQNMYSARSAQNRAKREEPQELPNQISMDELTQDSETVELLKQQNDLLRRLVNDVAFIVSELTGKGAQ